MTFGEMLLDFYECYDVILLSPKISGDDPITVTSVLW